MKIRSYRLLSTIFFLPLAVTGAQAVTLDDKCVINILNRTIQVSEDGGWALPNVPSNMGQIRARATCTLEDGRTVSGQSDYFNVLRNGITKVGDIKFETLDPIPVSLSFSTTDTLLLNNPEQTFPLTVTGFFADSSVDDLTAGDKGTNYSSTNENIATVSPDGLVTAKANGVALISARKDGVLASRRVEVKIGGDLDGDGIPDDAERALGLNPNDPIDALEDHDNDGLSALEEYQAGTNIFEADTDGDGLTDLEELTGGTNGIITNPLLADSDGDGISDGLEIAGGSDPNDSSSGDLADYLDFITVSPENLFLTYNAIDGEASGKLSVTGYMLDGTSVDLTQQSSGTRYTTDDITIANFGSSDGEIFAGQSGETRITVTNRDESFVVNVTVTQFDPVAQSTVTIPGYANNVDLKESFAFVAAGAAGLQIVDAADTFNPEIIGALDTEGISIDVKVAGDLAFVADGGAGLHVVDVSDVTEPTLLATADTAGIAQDLSVKGDFVFVADGSAGIEIFNVANPNKPFAVGSTEHLTDVKGIAVENNFMVAVGGTTLSLFDIEDPSAPLHLSSVNIGTVKDVEISNEYVYVAAYSTGYRIYKITDAGMLELKGGDRTFVPRDVAVTNGFTFFAEQLFPNVVAYVNTKNPDEPFFQDTINLSPLGDYAGTGIALNATHAFITEERFVVGSDYKATGDTKLFIAQYRELNDANGISPTVSLVEPASDGVTVEGARLTLTADAQDDIAVGKVDFYVNNLLVAQDTTYPYSVPFTVPQDVGNIAVKAVATDLGSNSATTVTVTLEVQNDEDGDGLGDEEEASTWMTDANNPDTDGDNLTDGEEVARGINPNNQDSDGDGRKDGDEVAAGTDPANPDIVAPTIIATEPTADQTEVAENSAIIVTFSEALSRKSIDANSIRVYGDGGVPVQGNVKLIGGDTQVLFTPDALMADYTLHEVVVGIVKDTAGNPLAEEQKFNFETGNTVDTVRPTVSNINPIQNAKDVPVNIALTVVMSERIDPESVTNDSFYIEDNSTRERIEGLIDVKDDSTTITFTPNAAFLVGRKHRIYLRSGIKDLFGNSMSNHNYYFTTAFDADGVAPLINSISVNEGETSVPVNAKFNIKFDEAINSYSTKNIKLFKGDEVVAVDLTNSSDLRTATLKPKLNLEPETVYTLVVDGISDLSGNLLESALSTSFSTGTQTDTQTGSLISYSPKNGATDVALNAAFTADFSERIDPTSLTSESFRLYNNTERRNEAATLSLSADGKRVTLTPDALLEEGHHYYVYISWGTYLKDIAGNNVGSYHQYTFTAGDVEDAQAPSVLSNNLSQGLTDVPVNAPVRLLLNESLAAHCVNEETVSLHGSTGAVAGSVTLSSDRRTITFTPDAYLVAGENYELVVAGVCDVAGNAVAEYRLDFTADSSGSVDTAYPRISSVTPTNNAADVSVNTAIVVTFNEAVDAVSISDTLRVQVNGHSGYVAGDYQVEGNVVTFTPSAPLPGSTKIRTSIYHVKDRVGNSACCWNYYFTTENELDTTAPTVSSISPTDGAMDIGVGTPIVLSFNESLNAATVNSNNFKLYSEGSIITPSVYRSADSKTITLRGTWPAGKSLSVIVTNDVQDLSGNAMADYVSLFSTAVVDNDNGRPSVSRLYPNSGANNVPSVGSIVMYTSEPMDESTLHEAFHVAENGILVEGQITLSASGQAIEFTPDEAFAEGALVHVYLDSTARDDSGNAMNHYQGQFRMATTTATAGVRPTPNAYLPSNGVTNVSLNPTMRIVYNQDMDETTITDEFIVMRNNDGSVFPATVSLADDLRTVEITPQSLLSTDSYYYVSLSSNILDTDGDRQYWSRSYGFTTGESAIEDLQAPRVTAMSPATGMENVALNPRYHVRFDEAINPYSFERIADMSVSYSASNTEVLYHRYSPLLESTEYTETITQVEDLSGNEVVSHSETFTTGTGPDLIRPNYSVYLPYSNSTVAVNSSVIWVMTEVVDPLTVNSGTVYVQDVDNGWAHVSGSASIGQDGKTITWVPDNVLTAGRRFYARLGGVADISGNTNSSDSFYFYTSLEEDTATPVVTGTSVHEGLTDVAVNARVRVKFNEAVNHLSLGGITLTHNGEQIAVSRTLDSSHTLVTLTPVTLLPAGETLSLNVSGVKDLADNAQIEDVNINFTTELGIDTQTGSLISYSPKNGATDVALNAAFTADFSERIDPTSLTSESFRLYNNTERRNEAAKLSLSADGKRVTLTPDALLEEGHHYYVYISWGTYLKDIAGNNVGSYHQYTFTAGDVEDAQAPSVLSNNLSQGLTDVPVNAPVRLLLNESLAAHCVNEETVSLHGSTGAVAGSVTLSSDRRTITFTPDAYLVAGENYELVVAGVCDVAGNAVAEYRLDFTADSSGSVDTAYPRISSVTPTNNAADVSVNTAIVVTFNEAVDAVSISDTLRVQVNGHSGYVAGDYQVEGNVVTFTPSAPLPGSTKIRTSIYHVKDRVGNSACCWNYYFTTENELDTTAPTVSSISPTDGAMDIGVGTPIVLSFNESLNAATVNSNNFKLYSEGSIITPSVYRSADSKTITLRGTWPAGKSLSVIVTNDVQDLSGNAMADYVSLFSTAVVDNDNGRPSVSRLYPNSGANNVPSVGSIVMYTSEPMDESTLHEAFHVAENGILVEGQITLSASGQAIEFTPDEAFAEGALVHVYLDSTARDDSGNAMNHYQGQFRMATTTATAGVRPTPNAYLPSNGVTNVSLNPTMRIVYNQDMDETTITDEFIVMRNNDGSVFPATVSLADDLRTVEITPQSLLSTDSYYYVSLSSNILDTDGDRQYWSRSYGFTTGESAIEDLQAPRVTAMSPATGMENVALNPRYHVRFDEAINPYSFERIADMSVSYSASNTEVLYHRYSPLLESTEYTETITQVEDLSGNEVVSHSETFTTGTGPDLIRPNYSVYLPYSNSTVAVNSSVIWVMTEVVDPLTVNSGTVYVQDVDNGWAHVSGSASIGQDGKTITWVPDNVLTAGRRFYARLGGVADISGNTNSSDSFYFYTSLEEDTATPVVTGTSVHEGLTDVAVNARVRVKFNEAVNHLSLGGITLIHNGEQIAVSRTLDSSHTLVTLTPVTLLPAGETLSLNVSGVKDLADNVQVEDVNINFTTELGIDTQTGSLISYSPNNGAKDVALNAAFTADFSERIDPTSLTSESFRLYNNTERRNEAATLSLSADGKRVTLTPDALLEEGHHYYVYISWGTYLKDIAGNNVGSYHQYTFTAGDVEDAQAPSVLSNNLSQGLTDVPINAPVRLLLNESLAAHCVNEETVSLHSSTGAVAGSVTLSSDRRTITFTPDAYLVAGENYELVVAGVCDVAGNAVAEYRLAFTTENTGAVDNSYPTLTSMTPAHGSQDNAVNAPIDMTFSEPLDIRNIASNHSGGEIRIYSGSNYFDGIFSFNGNVVTFTPTNPLPQDTQITINLRYIKDRVGNSYCCRSYSFTTQTL